MDERALFLVLRLLHIGFGVFWGGAMAMMAWFVIPSVRASGPAGGRVMGEVIGTRRLPVWLGTAAGLTILSGAVMYWRLARGGPGWAHSHMGITIGIGAAAALVAYAIGIGVSVPTSKKIAALGARMQSAGGPPDPAMAAEMQALQQRVHTASRIIAMLVFTAVLAMAAARYV